MVAALKFSFFLSFLEHFFLGILEVVSFFKMTVKVIFIKKWINHLEYTKWKFSLLRDVVFPVIDGSCIICYQHIHTHRENITNHSTHIHSQTAKSSKYIWINFVFISISFFRKRQTLKIENWKKNKSRNFIYFSK